MNNFSESTLASMGADALRYVLMSEGIIEGYLNPLTCSGQG